MDARSIRAQFDTVNPTRTDVEVGAGAALVALTQTSAPGWNLTGFGQSSPAQGWMASWKVDGQPVDGTAQYLPAAKSRMALHLLPVALGAAFAAMATGAWWRRRKAGLTHG
jgi:hypothetical protein